MRQNAPVAIDRLAAKAQPHRLAQRDGFERRPGFGRQRPGLEIDAVQRQLGRLGADHPDDAAIIENDSVPIGDRGDDAALFHAQLLAGHGRDRHGTEGRKRSETDETGFEQ